MSGERQPGKVSRSGRPAVCERLHAVLGTPERLSVYTPYWGLQRGRASTRRAGNAREAEHLHSMLGTPERGRDVDLGTVSMAESLTTEGLTGKLQNRG